MKKIVAALFAAVIVAGVSGATEVVSGDTASLLEAIESANPGETVLVPEGTYELTAQLEVTKGIILKASGAVEATVLKRVNAGSATSGQVVNRVLLINDSDARVEGFTITGGHICAATEDATGAGVMIGSLGGTLSGCVVTDNTGAGGKVMGLGCSVTGGGMITNCVLANNRVLAGIAQGGGAYLRNGSIFWSTVTNNVIDKTNTSSGGGGGVCCHEKGRIGHCVISGNTMRGSSYGASGGGGIFVAEYNWQSPAIKASDIIIDNCLVANNVETQGAGGGICCRKPCTVVNCTVVGNSAPRAGGISFHDDGVLVYNTLISGNASKTSASSEPEWNYSCGNATTKGDKAVCSNCLAPVALTSTSVNCDPGTPTYDNSICPYYPQGTSPAVDRGVDVAVGQADMDLRGQPRKIGDAIDIGCYEYQIPDFSIGITVTKPAKVIPGEDFIFSCVVSTKDEGVREFAWRIDGGDWTAWSEQQTQGVSFASVGDHTVECKVRIGGVERSPSAMVSVAVAPANVRVAKSGGDTDDLSEALAVAQSGTLISVGPGVYETTADLVITEGVELVSEAGAGQTEIRRVNVSEKTDQNVFERVLSINHAKAKVSGFTISGGRLFRIADCDEVANGAGVLIGASGGDLVSCVITNCTAGGSGNYRVKGVGLAVSSKDSTASNIVVRENRVIKQGASGVCGAVYLAEGVFIDGLIVSNAITGTAGATLNGGGALIDRGVLVRTRVEGNRLDATTYYDSNGGAGVSLSGAGRIANCTIVSNRTTLGYCGGVLVQDPDAVVENTLITGNSAQKAVGSALILNKGTVRNCTIAGNGSVEDPQSVVRLVEGNVVNVIAWGNVNDGVALTDKIKVSHSVFHGASGDGNLDVDPSFRNAAAGDYRPTGDSIVRDAGEYADWMAAATDLSGRPRVRKVGKVDIGCYALDPLGLILLVR